MTDTLLNYFNGDDLASSTWKNKYRSKGELSPDDMHFRMAKEFARIEDKYQKIEKDDYEDASFQAIEHLSNYCLKRKNLDTKKIYSLFKDFKYIIPQGSVMSQLGSESIGSLSNCFKGDVLVLTRDGWKPIGILANKSVEIMTKGGYWVYAPFKNYGKQQLWEIKLSNGYQEKILFATKDHRWAIFKKSKPNYIAEVKTTEQLKESLENKDSVTLYSTYAKQRNFKLSSVGIAHGITYGDGHTVKGDDNCNNITICSDLRKLGKYFPESYVSSDENNCKGGSDFYSGLPNYFRKLPDIRENKSYLYGWLAGYFAADGHITEDGSVMICSSKMFDIVFIKDVCGVLGIGCTEITQQTVISNLTNKEHTMYKCFIHKNHLSEDFFLLEKHKEKFNQTDKAPSRWKVISVKETQEIENVYCAEVPDTESFVIEGNILSMNCFVIGQPEDSYGGIFLKDQEQAQLMKRRGGVGLDISTLRPEGTLTSNAAKSSTGAVSFMHRFSNTTREVAQNGRRGALMLSMDVNHPDIMEFIKIKRDLLQVTGANISIKLNNEFMKAVENDEDYILRFPCDSDISYFSDEYIKANYGELHYIEDHKNDNNIIYTKTIKAKEYWNEIIKSAHNVAEPGLMFWNNMIEYSPDGVYPQFKQVTTNPCSEIAMQPYDACRLIAVNLFSFVKDPFTKKAKFDFEHFYKVNYEAMRLSDDLIDLELEHIERILKKIESDSESEKVKDVEKNLWLKVYNTANASRRTGLGFTALGDTLAALGLGYDSDNGLNIIENIMDTKLRSELDCTIDLAILRGTFKGWDENIEYGFIDKDGITTSKYGNEFYLFLYKNYPVQAKRMMQYGRRNVSWSTVAPTGTVSLMTQTTSGIEPLFQPFYTRRKKVNPNDKNVRIDFTDDNGDTWQEFAILHPKFKDWIYLSQNWDNKLEGKISFEQYLKTISQNELNELFKMSPWYGSTANDIDWIKRVKIQSVIQKYITHSISSTINLPKDVSLETVSEIYMKSWHKGLKGITVYRDGSRSGVLLSSNDNKPNNEFNSQDAVKRPQELQAETHYSVTKGIPYHVIIGLLNDKPYEVFIDNSDNKYSSKGTLIKESKGKYIFKNSEDSIEIKNFMSPEQQAITRLVSMSLRHRTDITFIVEQLQKIDGDMFDFVKSLSRVLKKYIPEGAKSTITCKECGSTNVVFEEGCMSCKDCGNSKCA